MDHDIGDRELRQFGHRRLCVLTNQETRAFVARKDRSQIKYEVASLRLLNQLVECFERIDKEIPGATRGEQVSDDLRQLLDALLAQYQAQVFVGNRIADLVLIEEAIVLSVHDEFFQRLRHRRQI